MHVARDFLFHSTGNVVKCGGDCISYSKHCR